MYPLFAKFKLCSLSLSPLIKVFFRCVKDLPPFFFADLYTHLQGFSRVLPCVGFLFPFGSNHLLILYTSHSEVFWVSDALFWMRFSDPRCSDVYFRHTLICTWTSKFTGNGPTVGVPVSRRVNTTDIRYLIKMGDEHPSDSSKVEFFDSFLYSWVLGRAASSQCPSRCK